jgi:hypothetical protein
MSHREHGEENFSSREREDAGEVSYATFEKLINELLQDSEELLARFPSVISSRFLL